MTKVRVDGYRCGAAYLLLCRVCGPLGVSASYAIGVSAVRVHLVEHGITNPYKIED